MIETPHPRRALFAGAGAVGAAAILAACSDGPEPGASGTSPAASPSASGGAASPSPDGDPNFVAKTSEIPVGGGKIFPDQGVVVTQPVKGTFKGFTNICTHMQCPLANVSGGTINCNCHFSKFSIKDGSVASPPATQPLDPIEIEVKGTDINLA